MCVPVSVATKGAVGGCTGICRIWPQVVGMIALAGIAAWNFIAARARGKKPEA